MEKSLIRTKKNEAIDGQAGRANTIRNLPRG